MKLNTQARNNLPTSVFADPSHRKFPLNDKAHLRSALSYIRYASPTVAAKIHAKAAAAGVGKSSKMPGMAEKGWHKGAK